MQVSSTKGESLKIRRLAASREYRRLRGQSFMEDIWKANNDVESNGTREKYATIHRSGDIKELLRCPICLGILRNTRTVMECLHRFCRECIDKSIRLGKNECPTCRTHCASRRSLRDDPQFDALIAALCPDLEKLDEEEFTLLEENLENNKKVLVKTQGRIAEALKRQSEALARFKRQKPVGNKARVAGVSRRAEREDEQTGTNRQTGTGQSCTHLDLNKDPAESSPSNVRTLTEHSPTQLQEGGGNERTKERAAIVTRSLSLRADRADGGSRQNDTGESRLFPDLNKDMVESSVMLNVCPALEDGERETMHGLLLLCDLASDQIASRFLDQAAAEPTEIKDDELQNGAEGGCLQKRKRGLGSTADSSSAASSDDSAAVHLASGDISEGQNIEVSVSPVDHRSLGTAKSIDLLLLEPMSNDHSTCTRVDKENGATEETQSNQDPVVMFTYERFKALSRRETGEGKAQNQTLKSAIQRLTPRLSRAKAAGPSTREKLCARASSLLNHLVDGARDEKEDEFDIQLHVKPLVEHSDDEDALPGLEQLYLSCPPRMRIQHLGEYLENRIPALRGTNVEILVPTSIYQKEPSRLRQPGNTKGHVLRLEYTLNYVWSNLWDRRGNMVLLYRGLRSDCDDILEEVAMRSGRGRRPTD